ncbi:hypothetical protein MKZ38_001310 [Zalerion maritima]|uniref:J domain-containing protein n=1 Tax=Zalerion maritima TaxID=339359 RepID=A0AAD5RQI6_9PEZI|nr:hypothetical protein MKZ38_001310 [Zalerion maritima]
MRSNNAVLSLLGWTFLPNLLSSWLQRIYYGITIRAGTPHPIPGSPKYNLHRRRIHILVVSLYLLYTIYEADHSIRVEGNYYTDLSLPFSATEKEIRSRMRRLAAQHHPDKTASGSSGSGSQYDSHTYFIMLQRASETLSDYPRRFAYERFGPEIHSWVADGTGRKFTTVRDYMKQGLYLKMPHYVVTAGVLYVMGLFNYLSFARWWRWALLGCVCMAELWLLTRRNIPWVLTDVVNPFLATLSNLGSFFFAFTNQAATQGSGTSHPPYLPFQLIELLRKISLTSYIALNQLGPLLRPSNNPAHMPEEKEGEALEQGLDRLDRAVAAMNAEAGRLVDMEMAPFANDPEALKGMKGRVKDWLVQNTVRSDPMVKDAVGNEIRKRRVDAPFGARGTR